MDCNIYSTKISKGYESFKEHFTHLIGRRPINKFAKKHDKKLSGISPQALEKLMHHSWSGNVREFQSALEYAVVLTKSEKVIIEDLPEDVLKEDGQHLEREENTLTKLVAEYEKEEIKKALENFNWNMQKAAQRLGLSERGLYRKIRKYALKK